MGRHQQWQRESLWLQTQEDAEGSPGRTLNNVWTESAREDWRGGNRNSRQGGRNGYPQKQTLCLLMAFRYCYIGL